MGGDINKISIIGRLTKDPELKRLPSRAVVAHVSIANNRIYTTNKGEKNVEVGFFDLVIWNKLGELVVLYLHKGSRIAIEGKLKQRRWKDDQGNSKSKIEIVVNNIQFLDSKKQKKEKVASNPIIGNPGWRMIPQPVSDDYPW